MSNNPLKATNAQLEKAADLARRNLEALRKQKDAPLPLIPLHPSDGARGGCSKRAALPADGAMPARRQREVARDAAPYIGEPLTNSMADAWPGKPMEECESLLDP